MHISTQILHTHVYILCMCGYVCVCVCVKYVHTHLCMLYWFSRLNPAHKFCCLPSGDFKDLCLLLLNDFGFKMYESCRDLNPQ